jgi:hypothetical protein
MSYSNYSQIERAIANRQEFTGNSCAGRWLDRSEYVVFSYSTLIYSDDLMTGKKTLNARKYSVTTSRLQNLIRRAIGADLNETTGRI